MAPELALKKDHFAKPTDLWALGVVFFALLTGKMPFHSAFENELYRLISAGKYQIPLNLQSSISKDAKRLLSSLLYLNPLKRLTAA